MAGSCVRRGSARCRRCSSRRIEAVNTRCMDGTRHVFDTSRETAPGSVGTPATRIPPKFIHAAQMEHRKAETQLAHARCNGEWTVQGDRTHQGDGRGGRWQHAQVEGMRGRRVGEVLAAEREGRIKMCTRGTRSASLCYWERATAMIRWQAGCTQALQRRSNRLPGRWMATRAGGEREGTNAISSVCRTGVVTCRGVGECAIRGL